MRRTAALAVMAVIIAGCAFAEVLADYGDPVDMQPDDLVGTWLSRTGDTTARTFSFHEDGTFRATHLPAKRFGRHSPRTGQPIDGRGIWSLEPSARDPEGPTTIVRLAFDEFGGEQTEPREDHHLAAADFDGVVLLVFWFEDGHTAYAKWNEAVSPVAPVSAPTPAGWRRSRSRRPGWRS